MSLAVLQAIPILRIFSVEKARDFYVGFLGFAVDWQHTFEGVAPVYMQVSLGSLLLHLSEHHGDCCPGGAVFLRVTGLVEYHQKLLASNYLYFRPGIGPTPWGTLCMDVTDPFGNRLSFNEDVSDKAGANSTGMQ